MNVLQINVRLDEGGAAGVALDLHRRSEVSNSINSSYLYGYGKQAMANPNEDRYGAKNITAKSSAIINFATGRLLGSSFIVPKGKKLKLLINELSRADIVHLHVIHSYFLNESWFIDLLIKMGKNIVWTLHDHWIVTGRCAFHDGCSQWKVGCGSCPTSTNYPPSLLDLSKSRLPEKRKSIAKLINAGAVFVSPSTHLATDVLSIYPNMDLRVIHNALNVDTEALILDMPPKLSVDRRVVRILIIAHDLSYEGKTNRDYVNQLMENEYVEIITVGKNSPFQGGNVHNYGYIDSKKSLYEIVAECDVMFFSSIVDNFPLVLGESLSLGLPVLATSSPAAKEVLSLVDMDTYPFEVINKAVSGGVEKINILLGISDPAILAQRSIEIFSGVGMLKKYEKIYLEF